MSFTLFKKDVFKKDDKSGYLIGKKITIEKLKKNKPFDVHRSRFFVYYVIVLPKKNGEDVDEGVQSSRLTV
jgi:hypothetical protein